MSELYLGVDVGAETVKLVAVESRRGQLVVSHRERRDHRKEPHAALAAMLRRIEWGRVAGIAATGRLGRVLRVTQVPTKASMRRGLRVAHPELTSATLIAIGAHGFSVLEVFASGQEHFQQNSRCSQGTGNFLGQLVARFGLTVEEASRLCDREDHPASLSGRCPVILKTDMTHLANQGESRSRILAGLYDAVCENVVTLVRPRLTPRDVVLVGGVTRSDRVRRRIATWLAARQLRLVGPAPEDEVLEALGAATHAMEAGDRVAPVPRVEDLLVTAVGTELERVPGLRAALAGVQRIPRRRDAVSWDEPRDVVLGLDIGSTGSKAVAVDAASGDPLWEAYLNTEGAPVRAAQSLVERWGREVGGARVLGFGVTGSGREVVGSLLRTCYGEERVFVMNEIAAHARGAVSVDPEVDTIFEIGGQDAKYIRLEEGRVIDAAMNEACSAGTGSFIAEQGAKLEGAGVDPGALGAQALEARFGISLGQHCSVFMAEVIDEAITQGIEREAIVMGLYDSVVQNYLNRVKGTRTIGQRIFCQGMPFSSDALAAAVARQTGRTVVVPPSPGTMGALGIALLVRDDKLDDFAGDGLSPADFLAAELKQKETFVCKSTKGCGGSGNKCRIDRLVTEVGGIEQRFLWGGNCSLYDRGTARTKLPDRAPDPFREREALVDAVLDARRDLAGAPVIALTDEFSLKGHLPLVATFLDRLGFATRIARRGGSAHLKRGIEAARIPYCAPLQMLHGVVFDLVEQGADYLLLPMVKSLPSVTEDDLGALCPMVLGAPDVVGGVLPPEAPTVLRPVIEFDDAGYHGGKLVECLRELARQLGALDRFEVAHREAVIVQERFEVQCLDLGRRALAFCAEHSVVPVVVHGRPYTVYNDVLNSNVPSLLRALGAVAIPLDCYPVDAEPPALPNQYWGYAQRNLRAAYSVRREPGVYSVFCSNYACGPDSFGLHFFAYAMQGKPFAIVETDGHSGDAGTKTRMEAFLYCVDADRKSMASQRNVATDFAAVDNRGVDWAETKRRRARVFIPRMSENAEIAAAALCSEGFRAEALPFSTRDDVRVGRQHTSGKECVPMMLTLGTMLNRVASLEDPDERVTFFMPTTHGPCRFGVYHSLHKLTLERLGMANRVDIVSPDETDYFEGMSADFSAKLWVGFAAHDLLQAMLFDVRPVERIRGRSGELFQRYRGQLLELMARPSGGSLVGALAQLAGRMWGARELLARAAEEFAALKDPTRKVPTVSVVGEIYVRLDPFANDFIVDKLEARGLRVRFAPFIEWLEYTTLLGERRVAAGQPLAGDDPVGTSLKGLIQRVSLQVLWDLCSQALGWGERARIEDALEAASPYVHPKLEGEAVLTLGGPLHEFREGLIHGAVIVGPHECMPCKIAEAQYGLVAENAAIPYLAVPLNGDPIDTSLLDRFAYDVHEHHQGRARRSQQIRLPVAGSPALSQKSRCSGECVAVHPGAIPPPRVGAG